MQSAVLACWGGAISCRPDCRSRAGKIENCTRGTAEVVTAVLVGKLIWCRCCWLCVSIDKCACGAAGIERLAPMIVTCLSLRACWNFFLGCFFISSRGVLDVLFAFGRCVCVQELETRARDLERQTKALLNEVSFFFFFCYPSCACARCVMR